MRKTIFRFILFLFLCLSILTLSNNLAHAQREASMRLEIPNISKTATLIMKDFAASATRFYLLYHGIDPEKKVSPWIRKVYVFDHEGTRRPDEEFELESEPPAPYGIAITDKLVYISYFRNSLIHAYGFDGTRLSEEDIHKYADSRNGIAATETHFYLADMGKINIYKFQNTEGDENEKRVSYVRSCKVTTTDAEGPRPFVAATDTRVYLHNPYDSTIYVYDAQDGGRRAREDFNNKFWNGKMRDTNVPLRIVSGIATTPLGGKLYLLLSQLRSDGKRGYVPVVYRYSISKEIAERPVIKLPAKPPRMASYYFRTEGGSITATDTNVYVAASGPSGLYGSIYSRQHSDGVPGSLFADSGKKAINFSLYDHFLYAEGMTVDYHNLYILRRHYLAASSPSFSDNPGSAYSVRYCSLNSEASIPNGATLLIDLELPFGMENFGRGRGLAIDSEGILYAMDSGENGKGGPRIFRFNPSTKNALPGNPITLHPNHNNPGGIMIVKDRAYVLDYDFNFHKGRRNEVAKIFVYALGGPNLFEYLPEESFTVDVGAGATRIRPGGSRIAINGNTFFISLDEGWPSIDNTVFVYGPQAAPSWMPIDKESIYSIQPYANDIEQVSEDVTGDIGSDKYQAIAGTFWTLTLDSDFLFGNPAPTVTFEPSYKSPKWLTLKDGVLSGTPPSEGEFVVELTATNEHGSADVSFTVNVGPAFTAVGWRDFSVPEARKNDAWSLSLKDLVVGNPLPEIYFTPGFVRPKWLRLREGVLSCTPPTAGIFPIKLTAGTYLNPPDKRNWADIVIYLVVKGTTSPSWELDTLNDTAQGIAATDNRVYVTDLIDDKIYVYGQDGKRYDTEDVSIKEFTKNPIGITTTDTYIYIVDNRDYTVSILDAIEKVPVNNFKLHPGNQDPAGIAATATRLYVVDNKDDKIYVYTHDGTHHPTEDVNLYNHREPTGITATSTRLYVVDGDTDKIYAYSFDGKLQSGEVVELVSENRSPTGITSTSSHLFVVDFLDQKVYSYPIPGTAVTVVGVPSWDPVLIPEAEQGSNWTLSLAKSAKGDPTPQIGFTEGYTPPDWLTLQDGVLSGTPTKAKVASIQVTATNSKGSADLIITLTVTHSEVPSWDLNPGEFYVWSIASTKTHVYVLYGIDYHFHISVYTHDGIRVPEMDIELGEEHMRPWSITANETDLYMVVEPRTRRNAEPDVRKIFRFDLTGSGETGILELDPVEGIKAGIAAATETRLYTLWGEKVTVFGLDGTHYANEDFALNIAASQGLYPQDIAITQTRIYFMTNLISRNAGRKKIYVYGHDGTPYTDENFVLSKIITGNLTVTSTHLMAYSGPPFRGIYTGSIFLFPLSNMEGITETVAQHPDTTPVWDVNQDGQVDIRDLIEVAQYIGETENPDPRADVNGDGTIDIRDLLIVSQHLGESTETAAPFRTPSVRFPALVKNITEGDVTLELIQTWIDLAQIANDGSLAFKRGIANLERLLAEMLPDKTELLANYPNPFNPETWIPYNLAKTAEVQITIYNIKGSVIRQLDLGQKAAGNYTVRSRAAHWDGHNNDGEKVASGIYFYQLRAGDYEHTRRMLIVK